MEKAKSRDWFKILISISLGILTFRLISALSSILTFFSSLTFFDTNIPIVPLCMALIVAIIVPPKISIKSQRTKIISVIILFILAFFPLRLNYSQQLIYEDKSSFDPISFNINIIKENPTDSYQLSLMGTDEQLNISKTSSINISHLKEAFAVYDSMNQDQLLIQLEFTEEGQKKLEQVTTQNINKRIGVIIDGALVYAPFIRERIITDRISVNYEGPNDKIIKIDPKFLINSQ